MKRTEKNRKEERKENKEKKTKKLRKINTQEITIPQVVPCLNQHHHVLLLSVGVR